MRTLTAGLFCTLVGVAVAVTSTARADSLRKGPYIIYPNEPSMMVVLVQAAPDPSPPPTIRWGTQPGDYNDSANMSPFGKAEDHQFRHVFTNLKESTRYFYRVDLEGEQHEGSFRTAPAVDATDVTFYAIGDTRTHPDMMNRILDRMLTDIDEDVTSRETLWVHVGDWVDNGDDKCHWQNEYFNRSYARSLEAMRRLPVMGCRGNHERSGRYLRTYFPYTELLPSPNSPGPSDTDMYFSFDYGPVHFAVVDDEAPRGDTSPQYRWLAADLQATNKEWIVVVFHKPAYSAGGGHGNNRNNEELVDAMKSEFGVNIDLVLAGHNHYYARCESNNVVHLTVGGGGAPLNAPEPDNEHVVEVGEALSFARIEVAGTSLKCRTVNAAGSIIDSFTIQKGPDSVAPRVIEVSGEVGTKTVTVMFDEAVKPGTGSGGAENVSHYSIPGAIVTGAVLNESGQVVTLTVENPLVAGQSYNFNVSGVQDRASTPNPVSPRTIVFLPYEIKVAVGDTWKYFKGEVNPGKYWSAYCFDDSSWLRGPTGIGYADDDDATVLDDMRYNYPTVFMRREFNITDPREVIRVVLNIDFDDGFAAYINGKPVASGNAPCHINKDSTAVRSHDAGVSRELDITTETLGTLRTGTNVLAIVLLNVDKNNSTDASLIPELRVTTKR